MVKQSDLLEAVSVADRVGELQFTVGQVCRMAGITKMQPMAYAAMSAAGPYQRPRTKSTVSWMCSRLRCERSGENQRTAIPAARTATIAIFRSVRELMGATV